MNSSSQETQQCATSFLLFLTQDHCGLPKDDSSSGTEGSKLWGNKSTTRSHGFVQGCATWSQANTLGQGWLCWLKTSLQQRRGPGCHAAHTTQPPQAASAETRRSLGNPTHFLPSAEEQELLHVGPSRGCGTQRQSVKPSVCLPAFFAALLDLNVCYSACIRGPVGVSLGLAPAHHHIQCPAPPVSLSAARRKRAELNLTLLGLHREACTLLHHLPQSQKSPITSP